MAADPLRTRWAKNVLAFASVLRPSVAGGPDLLQEGQPAPNGQDHLAQLTDEDCEPLNCKANDVRAVCAAGIALIAASSVVPEGGTLTHAAAIVKGARANG
jgi:hypothetical protein